MPRIIARFCLVHSARISSVPHAVTCAWQLAAKHRFDQVECWPTPLDLPTFVVNLCATLFFPLTVGFLAGCAGLYTYETLSIAAEASLPRHPSANRRLRHLRRHPQRRRWRRRRQHVLPARRHPSSQLGRRQRLGVQGHHVRVRGLWAVRRAPPVGRRVICVLRLLTNLCKEWRRKKPCGD